MGMVIMLVVSLLIWPRRAQTSALMSVSQVLSNAITCLELDVLLLQASATTPSSSSSSVLASAPTSPITPDSTEKLSLGSAIALMQAHANSTSEATPPSNDTPSPPPQTADDGKPQPHLSQNTSLPSSSRSDVVDAVSTDKKVLPPHLAAFVASGANAQPALLPGRSQTCGQLTVPKQQQLQQQRNSQEDLFPSYRYAPSVPKVISRKPADPKRRSSAPSADGVTSEGNTKNTKHVGLLKTIVVKVNEMTKKKPSSSLPATLLDGEDIDPHELLRKQFQMVFPGK